VSEGFMRRTIASVRALSVFGALAAAACGDSEPVEPTTTSTTSSTGGGGAGGAGPGGGGSGGGGTGGTGGGNLATAEVLVEFDAMMGELAEGLAVRDDAAYVGFLALGEIVAVDLGNNMVTPFGSTAPIPMDGGFFLGLAIDSADNVYGGLASFDMAVLGGVYQWPPTGGLQATPWAADNAIVAPNGLAFDADDTLYVSDSAGVIHTVDAQGTVSEWLSDPLLLGDAMNCMNAPTPFPIGANGIAVDAGNAYVANTNFATVIRIPIENNGNAGTPEVIAGPDCELLGGADGVALDGTTLYVTVNASNTVLAIDTANGNVTTIYSGMPLQSPASIAIAGDGSLIVTNAAFAPGQTSGLVRLTLTP
jgi:YVTN family beta-propeller protein